MFFGSLVCQKGTFLLIFWPQTPEIAFLFLSKMEKQVKWVKIISAFVFIAVYLP
jgi:hypothetical protein